MYLILLHVDALKVSEGLLHYAWMGQGHCLQIYFIIFLKILSNVQLCLISYLQRVNTFVITNSLSLSLSLSLSRSRSLSLKLIALPKDPTKESEFYRKSACMYIFFIKLAIAVNHPVKQ